MTNWRKNLYDILDSESTSVVSVIYNWVMLIFIIISLIPLAFREQTRLFFLFDRVSVVAFIIDYLLRWITADYQMPDKKGWRVFLIYPFTPFAIIDLLSILPSVVPAHRALKLFRISRLFKILRIFKLLRYSRNVQILVRVLRKEKHILSTVFFIAVGYIFITALIMFNAEDSELFADFFDALYWATTTLTTVGYGDIYPTSDLGRVVSMFSAVFGVAIIALPSGVITASYMDELKQMKEQKPEKESDTPDNQTPAN
ncbi:MAG: ion transporter [Paludibacteraceae bacterium]|nr:ion transporter [Paludibacteraceae bacterium]